MKPYFPFSTSLLVTVLLIRASSLDAATVYTYTPSSGSWGTAANWNTESYPDDTDDSNVTIGSGKNVAINDGSFSAGYIFVGSSGILTASGSGNGLTIGATVNASGNSMVLSGNGGILNVSDNAFVQGFGRLLIGDTTTPGSVTHPTLEITNATVSFSSIQFAGGNANVQGQIVLNGGAELTLANFTSGAAHGGSLVFNGDSLGFGSLSIGTLEAGKVVNLLINPGSYTGLGSFTLIDATSWSGSFSSIVFNGSEYTFGTDVVIGEQTWNIDRSGNDLILNVIPEPAVGWLLGISTVVLLGRWGRRSA